MRSNRVAAQNQNRWNVGVEERIAMSREEEKELSTAHEVQGREVRLPLFIRQGRGFAASYTVPSRKVREFVAPTGLQVVDVYPGHTMCTLAAVSFEDSDLGAYIEFVVAFAVREEGPWTLPLVGMALDYYRGRVGMYLHHMAVSDPFVAEVGKRVWGFSVSCMDVRIAHADGKHICSVHDGASQVLTFSVRNSPRWPAGAREMNTYAFCDGERYRAPWVVDAQKVGARNGGAELELGHHPFADELRALGLPKRALMSATVGAFSAQLGAPLRTLPQTSSEDAREA